MKSLFIRYTGIAFFFLFSSILLPLFGQTKAKFKVYTNDAKAIVKMDHKTIKQKELLETDTGKYVFSAWAPTRQLVKKEMTLNDTTRFSFVKIKLPHTDEYISYRKKLKNYYKKRFIFNYLPTAAYSIHTAYNLYDIVTLNRDAKKFKENAENHKSQFEGSFWLSDIESNRNLFIQNKNDYNNTVDKINKKWRVLKVSTAVSAGIIYYTKRVAKKLKKPTYSETPLLSNLLIVPLITPENNQILLSLNF